MAKSKADKLYRVALRGDAILHSPRWNKGSAFTLAERRAFGLTGRLPVSVNPIEEQCERAWLQLKARESPISKNTFLQSLREQNWVLYYTLISKHLTELMPIIYTPTEVSPCPCAVNVWRAHGGGLGGGNLQLLASLPEERGHVPHPPQYGYNGGGLPGADKE